jgi:hypothetical protein
MVMVWSSRWRASAILVAAPLVWRIPNVDFARNRGGLGVGVDDAHRRQQQAEFAAAVVIYS